jgi:hypothetical protein
MDTLKTINKEVKDTTRENDLPRKRHCKRGRKKLPQN